MTFADSLGVMPLECKRGVYQKSNEMFTPAINRPFTVRGVRPNRIQVAKFAVSYAQEKHGWNKAELSRQLFGEEKRQWINSWLKRGLPADQDAPVANKLGLTVEQLLAAGRIEVPEDPLPPEAIEFAREWMRLPAITRNNIRATVLGIIGPGRDDSGKGLPVADRPSLYRR